MFFLCGYSETGEMAFLESAPATAKDLLVVREGLETKISEKQDVITEPSSVIQAGANLSYDTSTTPHTLNATAGSSSIAANRVAVSGSDGSITASSVTTTELDSLDGITGGTIQSQLNASLQKPTGFNQNGTFLLKNVDGGSETSQVTDLTDVMTAGANISISGTEIFSTAQAAITDSSVIPNHLITSSLISGGTYDGNIEVKNMIYLFYTSTTTVSNGGNNGWFPDIFDKPDSSNRLIGRHRIIDTSLFSITTASSLGITPHSGGNTANVDTGANARWGVKILTSGLYHLEYMMNFENESFDGRKCVLVEPSLVTIDSGGSEGLAELENGFGAEYTRDDGEGQYCCIANHAYFTIPDSVISYGNVWFRFKCRFTISGEDFNQNGNGIKLFRMNCTIRKISANPT